ncbi:MAG: NAD(P)H-hydrate dehydratase [Proteobacteria bacterium]|nr:NAD(P)H-hydrate dehydratase [Pseudomonadota bacterium]
MNFSPRELKDIGRLPNRPSDAHKGLFGHLLVIGGQRGMSGAASLSAQAALATGAGIVTIAAPDHSVDALAALCPEYMLMSLKGSSEGQFSVGNGDLLRDRLGSFSTIAIGPGMGLGTGSDELIVWTYAKCPLPVVIDADAINCLAKQDSNLSHSAQVRILTPHPKEFERLTGVGSTDRNAQIQAALNYARSNGVIVVLKGHRTFVTDGVAGYVNETGNPGMAIGGMGDCLTGMIGALLAQKMSAFDAACLGVAWHGMSGDIALERLGGHVVRPLDLIRMIPAAQNLKLSNMIQVRSFL